MSQIDELQARITAALDRIAQGLESNAAGAQEPEAEQRLRQDLEDERLANAQLQERVKALHARVDALEAEATAAREAEGATLRRLDTDLQSLRKANQQLRDNNQALREAHQAGVAEPHLINKSMLAELEGLRAARRADRDEVETVLDELARVIDGAEPGAVTTDTQDDGSGDTARTEASDA